MYPTEPNPFQTSVRSPMSERAPSYNNSLAAGSPSSYGAPSEAAAPNRAQAQPQAKSRAPLANVLRRKDTAGKKNEAPASMGAKPPKPSRAEKRAKFVAKWSSKKGLAKIGIGSTILAAAGVGAYYGIQAIIAAVHTGISAKAGSLLLPIGITIGATLVVAVAVRALYKGITKMHAKAKAKAEKEEEKRYGFRSGATNAPLFPANA